MGNKACITLLGSGCSTGVPKLDGNWGKCNPDNPKNYRTRCGAWVEIGDASDLDAYLSLLIDTTTDLREQALREKIRHVHGVLYTHDHADQTHGIDDLRSFSYKDGNIQAFMNTACFKSLTEKFHYIFYGKNSYPAICDPHLIDDQYRNISFKNNDLDVTVNAIRQFHGSLETAGFRIGNMAYSGDVSEIPQESLDRLKSLKVWIVDCLRFSPHPSHAHYERVLEWVSILRPEKTILTNMHSDMDYDHLCSIVPENITVGFDGLKLEFDLE